MENATKALLIAAAVLIAIILISLGVSIVSSAQSQINKSSSALDSAEIEAFNAQFRSYEGTSVSGTKVQALARIIIQNNKLQADEGKCVQLTLTGYTGTDAKNGAIIPADATVTKVPTAIKSGYRYTVECNTAASGLIDSIVLTEVKNKEDKK